MHDAVRYIHDHGGQLAAEHIAGDELGRLTDTAAEIMRASGGMRLLQPASHGGHEASPLDFYEWVRAVGRYNPSCGWVAGVVGVHPWELGLVDSRLQDDILGESPDTWVASPYAPQGRAKPEGEGFRLSGEWSYSTGTDHCDWVVLGGLVVVDEETAPEFRHFFLPRGDYEIVEDSWNVMGLSGTGSKDVRVQDAYVPEYRTVRHEGLAEGEYNHRRADSALFQLPFGCIFSAAIASATFGIAQCAVAAYRDYVTTRVSAGGVVGTTDPRQQEALAEVEADLEAGVVHLDVMTECWMDRLRRGEALERKERLAFRRNQVRAVQRVISGIDQLFARAGSSAVWTTRPLERRWRDLRTAGSHFCNMADSVYYAWANEEFETGVVGGVVMH